MNLYLGDCLDVMQTMDAGSVDAVITSPPYNIGKSYATVTDSRDDYVDWLVSVFDEVRRISSCFWLNTGYRKLDAGNIPIAYQIWDKVGMYLMQTIKWEYGAGLTYKKRFNHRTEDWMWFVSNPNSYVFNLDDIRDPSLTKYKKDKRNNPNGKLPGDVWYFPHVAGTFTERCKHPAQYPVAMIERIIRTSTNEGMSILDPFMGSGTTGAAAVQTGRNFVGIELDAGYFAIAQRRIAEAQAQPSLLELA